MIAIQVASGHVNIKSRSWFMPRRRSFSWLKGMVRSPTSWHKAGAFSISWIRRT
jgi:hypothetical protein